MAVHGTTTQQIREGMQEEEGKGKGGNDKEYVSRTDDLAYPLDGKPGFGAVC